MQPSSSRSWIGRLFIVFLSAIAFITTTTTGSVSLQRSPFLSASLSTALPSAQAQPARLRRVNPTELAARVYAQVPALPLENQYIGSDGKIAENNTLVSRIIRYHLYSKERPTNFRFDWKLTMADYLGAFDRISADNYASYGLRENPAEADVAVIRGLSREVRDRLTNALYEAFTPPASDAADSAAR